MRVGERIVRSRFRGTLLGVAVGDALGAPVEFLDRARILERYGPYGVGGLEPWATGGGVPMAPGAVTDDTQMTMATALGLLDAASRASSGGLIDVSDAVWARYSEWELTQHDPGQARYPGTTCLAAIRGGSPGSPDDPVNDSKGCGGVMRVAPVALAFEPVQAFERGAEVAALTHGHPTGWLAAGFLADVVSRLVRGPRGTAEFRTSRGGPIPGAIAETREVLLGYEECDETLDAVDRAVELYISDAPLERSFELLGEGWVAEEALAIGLYAALSFPEDFREGVLAAVNITGDSDSTGSITGALLGAALGDDALPAEWSARVEHAEQLSHLAEDLYDVFSSEPEPADW